MFAWCLTLMLNVALKKERSGLLFMDVDWPKRSAFAQQALQTHGECVQLKELAVLCSCIVSCCAECFPM